MWRRSLYCYENGKWYGERVRRLDQGGLRQAALHCCHGRLPAVCNEFRNGLSHEPVEWVLFPDFLLGGLEPSVGDLAVVLAPLPAPAAALAGACVLACDWVRVVVLRVGTGPDVAPGTWERCESR